VNFSAGGSIFGQQPAKKEGSDDEAGGEGDASVEEEVPITGPSKLPLVAVVTGEEDENTLYNVRAKLFVMTEGKWQERGVGQLKLNQAKDGDCRLLMRDNGGKHLRLNAKVFPEMKVDKSGDKSVCFVAVAESGKGWTTYAARVSRKEEAEELIAAIEQSKSATGGKSVSNGGGRGGGGGGATTNAENAETST